MIKAIIFDIDNTLLDFMTMKSNAINAAVIGMIKNGLDIDNIVFIPVATYDNTIEFPDDKKFIHEKSGETIEGTPIQETWYYVGYKDDNNPFTTYLSSNGIGNLNSGNNYIFKYAPPKDIERHNSYVNFKETKLTNWKSTVMFPYQRYIP